MVCNCSRPNLPTSTDRRRLGMLIAMLVVWNVEGKPHYASMENSQTIAYISDVGAQGLKPLFITGSVITTIFLDISFLSERWLRHRGRLVRNQTVTEKVLSGLSMLFAVIGTVGLILLSIFDTFRHPQLHDIFLVLFIGGYLLSAICICWEYQRLGIRELECPFCDATSVLTDARLSPTQSPSNFLLDQTLLHHHRCFSRYRWVIAGFHWLLTNFCLQLLGCAIPRRLLMLQLCLNGL